MLVEFSVTNFRSIRDKQTLSMVKGKGSEHEATHTFKPTAPGSETLLKSAAIYGANAAGKSNIIKAISTMRKIVVESAKWQLGDKLPVTPFMFDPETPKQPTEFEIIFIQDNVRYQYGFSATEDRIWSEWLFAFPKGRSQRWFERNYNPETAEYTWHLDSNLKGEKRVWKESTRDNALFLSVASQLNSGSFKSIFIFFDKLNSMVSDLYQKLIALIGMATPQMKKDVLTMLRNVGIVIDDFSSLSQDELVAEVDKSGFLEKVKAEELLSKVVLHKVLRGEKYQLPFEEESDGSKKMIVVCFMVWEKLIFGGELIIDELNNSLHPSLVKYLVSLFNSVDSNPKHAQLIFTTHETSVLDQDVFRRDQIWFCEKGENQATRLYSLLDFKPRKGYENLEAAYLAGRYGAVPMIQAL